MLEINLEMVENVLVTFIKETVTKNGFKKGIVGVSGGLDSAVVLSLTRRALGSENTLALLMPYKTSSPASLADGREVCGQLGVTAEEIDISPSVDAYFDRYPTEDRTLIGNKCARERMSVLYDFSGRQGALVVGTSNKSELLIGYSTLFGDSAAAFLPIGDLYKGQVVELARHLGIPRQIIEKKPSADLWKDQTDEGEIGMSYGELDDILYRLVDCRQSPAEIVAAGHGAQTIAAVENKIRNTQYKRTLPQVCKLQARTVGIDFRYPRDWNK